MPYFSSFSALRRPSLFRHLRRFAAAASPPISISAAKSRLSKEHDPDKALAIFSSISSRLPSASSSRHALSLAAKRLAKSRRFSDLEALVEAQKQTSPFAGHEPFLSSLILVYGRCGMADHAVRTFEQMNDLTRSAASFNAVLSACNLSKNFDQVPKLFSEFSSKYQIRPDKFSYGILIKSLCESGSPERALHILEEMKKRNVEITQVTYTTLLDVFYRKGRVKEAEMIWEEMSENGLLDVAAYNVKIMYAHKGKAESVLRLMGEMMKLGLKPDVISYNYLISCHCRNGRIEDAKKVYEGLLENGCLHNAATFRNFLYYLCKNGDFDTGLKVFLMSVKRNKVPEFQTVKALVEGLAKGSRMKEAKKLISIVKKRFPVNFLNAWRKVEENLGLKRGKD